jgi:hypothetical protein
LNLKNKGGTIMPVKAKYIKDLPLKKVLDGSESLLVQDLNGTQQASLEVVVDEIKQNSQEKIREIESELAQTNAQLSDKAINIKFNGVLPNQKVDSSEQLQSLINDTKNDFYLPDGEWILNKLDLSGKRANFFGNGEKTIIKITEIPEGRNGFTADGFDEITFNNIKFVFEDGGKIGYGDSNVAMVFRNGNYLAFNHCYFDNLNLPVSATTAIHIKTIKKVDVIHCKAKLNKHLFLGLGMTHRPTNIDEITLAFNDVDFYGADAKTFFDIDNEPLQVNATAEISSAIVIGNNIRSNDSLGNKAIGIGYVKNSVISNNVFTNFNHAFDVDNPINVNISGNVIRVEDGFSKGYAGFRVSSSEGQGGDYALYPEIKNVLVSNNLFVNIERPLETSNGDGLFVSGNSMIDCTYLGYFYKNKNSTIKDNYVELATRGYAINLHTCNNIDFIGNIIKSHKNSTDISFARIMFETDGVKVIDNHFDVDDVNIKDFIVVEAADNKKNIVFKNNKGLNDRDLSEFVGKIIVGGMEFTYDGVTKSVTGTLGVPFVYNTQRHYEKFEIIRRHIDSSLNVTSMVNEIYCEVDGQSYNIFLDSELINKTGKIEITMIKNTNAGVDRVNVTFNGNGWTTEAMNGVSKNHALLNPNEKLIFYLLNGKVYKLA